MSRIRLVSAVVSIVGALACAGDGTDPGPAPDGSITISPGALTLNVGGSGTLSAVVRDGSGATVSATVAWATRNPLVASIDNGGNVTGISAGQTVAVANAGGRRDSVLVIVVDDLTLEVSPASGTVQVGKTFQFSVVAKNGAGQVIPTPAVTWASASPSIATINASGVATGVARGVAAITASARSVTSPPAMLTVSDAASACDGIASVTSWQGQLDYAYAVHGTTEGGFVIDSDNKGNVTATLTVKSLVEPFFAWSGKLSGTASVHETKTSEANVAKLDGGGPMITLAGAFEPTMSLIVDTRTCTYKLTIITNIAVKRTEFGSTTDLETSVAAVQVGNTTPLGSWKQLGISDLGGSDYPGHSTVWAASHLDKNAFVPLGFAVELLDGSPEEPQVGNANVSYVLIPH